MLMLVAGILGGIIGYGHGKRSFAPTEVVKTDTIRTTDTIKLHAPPPDTVTLTKVKTVKVPIHDTVTLVDSVWIDLPFEQHFARIGKVADVWFSGYDAKIDSAVAYEHHTTEIVNHIAEVSKMPRLTAGVGCGAIYRENRVNAYLFGEMRYNAPKSTFGTFAAIDQNGRWCLGGNVCWRLTIIK